MNPLVSICIPTYLQTDFLRKTLNSIKEQTFEEYEIVITDDSPDDSVAKLLLDFDFKGKLRYSKNTNTLGTPQNWNRCVSQARGYYIKLLHHDDWFATSESLGQFVELMQNNPQSDFGFCASVSVDKGGLYVFTQKPTKRQLHALRQNGEVLFLGNFIGAPSVTIYKNNLGITYDTAIRWMVDVDFYIQLLIKNPTFAYTDSPLVNVTMDGEHQVTREFQENRSLEIGESVYLYKKIKKSKSFLSQIYFFFKVSRSRIFKNTKNVIPGDGTPPEIALLMRYDVLVRKIKTTLKAFIKRKTI